jgi:spore germination cell wall hydrolase CwlJ-like protein
LAAGLAFVAACALGRSSEAADIDAVGHKVDERSLELLAKNMYYEAGGEGRNGMLAVGWVVLNRVADDSFPPTIEDVVLQGCQFGWTCDERSDEPPDTRPWQLARRLAGQLLSGFPPPDPTRGGMWFHHADQEDPGWGGRIAPSVRIGGHLFYARVGRLHRPSRKPTHALQMARR